MGLAKHTSELSGWIKEVWPCGLYLTPRPFRSGTVSLLCILAADSLTVSLGHALLHNVSPWSHGTVSRINPPLLCVTYLFLAMWKLISIHPSFLSSFLPLVQKFFCTGNWDWGLKCAKHVPYTPVQFLFLKNDSYTPINMCVSAHTDYRTAPKNPSFKENVKPKVSLENVSGKFRRKELCPCQKGAAQAVWRWDSTKPPCAVLWALAKGLFSVQGSFIRLSRLPGSLNETE